MTVYSQAELARRLDPTLANSLGGTLPAHLPDGELTVGVVRAIDSELLTLPSPTGSSEWIPRADGSSLELRRYVPTSLNSSISRAVILWIHSGGMFLGSARQDDGIAQELSDALGIRIASVDYRLAPENPYPEPLEDCYTALAWLAARYDRVFVVGASAGGGLAAGLALLARDRSGPAIAGLQLVYPMLDDRETVGGRELADTFVWNARLNRLGWNAYTDGIADEYAAPARATDLTGLPPTYVEVGDLDLFCDEASAFATALSAVGVPVEFVVDEGAVHGFDLIAPDAPVSVHAKARRQAWLSHLLAEAVAA